MILTLDQHSPEHWKAHKVIRCLKDDGVVVLPTDTVYGLTTRIDNPRGIRRIYEMKDLDPKKPLAILCSDLAMVAQYVRGIPNQCYRIMKRVLPGPYTIILEASKNVPKIMLRKRKTIGIRIPESPISLMVLEGMDVPLLTTSIRLPDDAILNDPVLIDEMYGDKVEMVVDGGELYPLPSTVVDFTNQFPEIIREGKGPVDDILEL